MNSRDPAKRAAHSRRMALRRKYRVLSHYSAGAPVCVCCGESQIEFLALDQIDGGGTQHRKAIGLVGGGKYSTRTLRERTTRRAIASCATTAIPLSAGTAIVPTPARNALRPRKRCYFPRNQGGAQRGGSQIHPFED